MFRLQSNEGQAQAGEALHLSVYDTPSPMEKWRNSALKLTFPLRFGQCWLIWFDLIERQGKERKGKEKKRKEGERFDGLVPARIYLSFSFSLFRMAFESSACV